MGTGLFLGAGTLYLTRSAGLTPGQVGLGLTIAGALGLVAGILLGDQADRRGARGVVIASMLLEAAATVALIAVHDVVALALIGGAAAVGRAGSSSGRGALIGLLAAPEARGLLRSHLRALTNVGVALGMVGAGVVLALDARAGYVAMLLVDAVTFLGAAWLVSRLAAHPPTRVAGDGRRWVALRDHRFLALTVVTAVVELQYFVLVIVLPLWIALETSAPRWSAAVLLLLAAGLVAVLQVPASRGIGDARSAARFVVRSGPVFLIAWALMAEASGHGAALSLALLVVAVVIHSVAEVWQVAGMFELSFLLAAPEAQGQYQGVFGLGGGVAEAVAPVVLIGLCLTWGRPGWIVLGLIVSVAGLAVLPIERWHHRSLRG